MRAALFAIAVTALPGCGADDVVEDTPIAFTVITPAEGEDVTGDVHVWFATESEALARIEIAADGFSLGEWHPGDPAFLFTPLGAARRIRIDLTAYSSFETRPPIGASRNFDWTP